MLQLEKISILLICCKKLNINKEKKCVINNIYSKAYPLIFLLLLSRKFNNKFLCNLIRLDVYSSIYKVNELISSLSII